MRYELAPRPARRSSPPPLTPPLKGEGKSALRLIGIVTGEVPLRVSPSPLRGGVRGGGPLRQNLTALSGKNAGASLP